MLKRVCRIIKSLFFVSSLHVHISQAINPWVKVQIPAWGSILSFSSFPLGLVDKWVCGETWGRKAMVTQVSHLSYVLELRVLVLYRFKGQSNRDKHWGIMQLSVCPITSLSSLLFSFCSVILHSHIILFFTNYLTFYPLILSFIFLPHSCFHIYP